ncbi:glutathione peroxidase [Bifidobacterium minimum]|uniref:Glutathione peroxidase n=2 Tax=Bifidobacterium minimum TaxID=1693 RepID=A0A087BMU2_9BIFI|nr:glutathione peroxidase [Bifidobacterium minimum]KFI72342.1 glutathione peroxidase [Bifidobacterium minimum]
MTIFLGRESLMNENTGNDSTDGGSTSSGGTSEAGADLGTPSAGTPSNDVYAITVRDRDGRERDLSQWRGQVLLIVNTATGCGFTPQYEGLEKLYRTYHTRGLEILDFPCNQFAGQAPGTAEEIHDFCTLHYDTTFPQFAKIKVNGKDAGPLYVWLKSQPGATGRIAWNFTKFLIDRTGRVVARFGSRTTPEQMERSIAALL